MQGEREIVFTRETQGWFARLSEAERDVVLPALERLRSGESDSSKSWIKPIKSSRHRGMMRQGAMQELRPRNSNIRLLFALDPRGRAVVLIGGDKTDQWRSWYERNVPVADRLFDQHLHRMGGGERWQALRTQAIWTGRPSEPRSR